MDAHFTFGYRTFYVIELWKNSDGIAISKVGYAETLASFYRKSREGNLPPQLLKSLIKTLKADWRSFIRIDLSAEVDKCVDRLISKHPLRGFDAIHLASSLTLHKTLKENLSFVGADQRLLQAAADENMFTHDVH